MRESQTEMKKTMTMFQQIRRVTCRAKLSKVRFHQMSSQPRRNPVPKRLLHLLRPLFSGALMWTRMMTRRIRMEDGRYIIFLYYSLYPLWHILDQFDGFTCEAGRQRRSDSF